MGEVHFQGLLTNGLNFFNAYCCWWTSPVGCVPSYILHITGDSSFVWPQSVQCLKQLEAQQDETMIFSTAKHLQSVQFGVCQSCQIIIRCLSLIPTKSHLQRKGLPMQ